MSFLNFQIEIYFLCLNVSLNSIDILLSSSFLPLNCVRLMKYDLTAIIA